MHGDQSLLVAAEGLRLLSPLCSVNLPGCVHVLLKVSTNRLLLPLQNELRLRTTSDSEELKQICLPFRCSSRLRKTAVSATKPMSMRLPFVGVD